MDNYFNAAEQVSYMSDYGSIQIGCVIVHKKSIISVGYNSKSTHPLQKMYSDRRGFDCIPYVHAEIAALSKIKYKSIDWSNVSLYTFRRNRKGELANSRPCAACQAVIKDFGIRKIYYTTALGYTGEKL